MMQEQRDHLDAKIIVLLGSIKNMHATTGKNSNKIIAIQNQFGTNSDGPHNKRQSTAIWTLIQWMSWKMQMLSAAIEMPLPLILVAQEVLNAY
eukprot:165556-Ditylum_brightwellii.AAC.1